MHIIEDASMGDSLNTNLPTLVDAASNQTEDNPFTPDEDVPIGDAAILMAADGYGKGSIKGRKNDEIVIIKTSETDMQFTFDREPDPSKLYEMALKVFEKIKDQRHMEHGK